MLTRRILQNILWITPRIGCRFTHTVKDQSSKVNENKVERILPNDGTSLTDFITAPKTTKTFSNETEKIPYIDDAQLYVKDKKGKLLDTFLVVN